MIKIKFCVNFFCLMFISLFVIGCATTKIEIDYPVFKKDKRGRQLKQFLGDTRNIAFVVTISESTKKNKDVQDFIEQIPSKVYEVFNRESYFKLIDITKRTDLVEEMQFSATGLAKNKAKIGQLLGVEAFFYMTINNPQIECSQESFKTKEGEMSSKSVLSVMIPLDMTLIKVESSEVLKSVSSKIQKYEKSGKECPSILTSFFDTVKKTSEKLNSDLSPKVKTADIKIYTGSPDIEVNRLLKDVSNELKGETPNYQSAFKLLQEANNKTNGDNWKVLANLGTYYYATRNYKKAVEFYGKAMKKSPEANLFIRLSLKLIGKKSDREYIRDLRKKVMVTFIFKK